MLRTSKTIASTVSSKILHLLGTIVLKRTDGSAYRSFLRPPADVVVSALQMVAQSIQTDPPPSTTEDLLAQDFLQCCSPDAVEAYHQSRRYCMGDVQ